MQASKSVWESEGTILAHSTNTPTNIHQFLRPINRSKAAHNGHASNILSLCVKLIRKRVIFQRQIFYIIIAATHWTDFFKNLLLFLLARLHRRFLTSCNSIIKQTRIPMLGRKVLPMNSSSWTVTQLSQEKQSSIYWSIIFVIRVNSSMNYVDYGMGLNSNFWF